MNDSDILREAFRGFEDQADRLSAARAAAGDTATARPRVRPARRTMLMVGATAATVAAVATGVALVGAGGSPHRAGGGAGARPSATSVHPTATGSATLSTAPTSNVPSSTAPTNPTPTTPTPATSASRPAGHVPADRQQMISAFKRVLGHTATFTVTQSQGNFITGILTAKGRQGGYDIQAYSGHPGDKATCEDPGTSHCVIHATANGGSLSTGHEPEGAGELYLVNYVRPDGDAYLMHLSTHSDPKGAGPNYGTKPPLTIKQMTAILESKRW